LYYPAWRVAVLGVMALLMLLPVTLPVPVLRELVAERFGVSELLTSLFMSINMVGAVLAAPLAGALADRFGRRPLLIAAALALDALCFLGLTRDGPFALFLAIRFVEGCAHIFALSLLLGLASGARPEAQRGLVMGATGSGLLLGVAMGAPLGGRLGHPDPLVPLYVGASVVAFAALLALGLLRETEGRERERPSLGEIARLVRAHRIVAIPLLFAFADRFTVGFFTSTFPLFLRNLHELPPPRIGLLIAVFMLPFAALSFPFGILSQRTSRAFVLCSGSFAYGCLVASLGFWPTDALLGVMLATGTAAAVMFVPSMLFTADVTPESVRTTSMGAFNAAGSLGFIVGPITGGLVSQSVAAGWGWEAGYAAAFAVAGGFKILLALGAFGVIRRFEVGARRAPS
jgi:MFS family permease